VIDREDISWPLLNAYVDGELSRDDAARVAAAIAADREVAAKVATLTQLRAAVAEAEPLSPPPVVLPQARPRVARRLPWAVAACFALLIAAVFLGIGHRPSPGSSLSAAIAAHQLWLAQTPPGMAPRLDVAFASAEAAGSLPDLSLASLRLVHLSLDPSGHRGGGMLAGYVGPNGCRVGLWIAPVEAALPLRPAVQDRDGLAIRAWHDERASYALLGRDIDPARLDGIAALVARITRDEPGVPREQVAALAEARSVGPACLG
jgi:hypothetical protein